MSLLSAKNFLGPIIDKRNLVTIVLVASFFAVYRLSGGKVHGPIDPSQLEVAPIEQALELDALSPGAGRRAIPAEVEQGSEDILREVRSARGTTSASRKAEAPADAGAGLDDIERSLGLR